MKNLLVHAIPLWTLLQKNLETEEEKIWTTLKSRYVMCYFKSMKTISWECLTQLYCKQIIDTSWNTYSSFVWPRIFRFVKTSISTIIALLIHDFFEQNIVIRYIVFEMLTYKYGFGSHKWNINWVIFFVEPYSSKTKYTH
jgi:hypothetical protein